MKTFQLKGPFSRSTQLQSEPCVMALGFFDGIHIGHQKLIHTAKKIALTSGHKLAVMTFSPHPSTVIKSNKEAITKYITPLSVQEDRFRALGVDLFYVVHFTPAFAQVSHEQFVNQYIDGLSCKHAVVGFDFTYGHKGKGNTDQLISSAEDRFGVTVVSKVERENQKVSSTLIREKLASGRIEEVEAYLGQSLLIKGRLKHAYAERYILQMKDDYLLPCSGDYGVTIMIEDFNVQTICNVDTLNRQLVIQLAFEQKLSGSKDAVLYWNKPISNRKIEQVNPKQLVH